MPVCPFSSAALLSFVRDGRGMARDVAKVSKKKKREQNRRFWWLSGSMEWVLTRRDSLNRTAA